MNVIFDTNIGLNRAENQDRVMVKKLHSNTVLAVLCDGMGGENAGSVASELAVNIIFDRIETALRPNADENSIRNLLISAACAANAVVYSDAQKNKTKIGMGTTCVIALVTTKLAHILNVGDSRAYMIDNERIIQITRDHTVVRLLFDEGKITAEEMRVHPQRNLITKAIGADVAVEPDYFEIEVLDDTKILLCSDGLSNYCSPARMREVANEFPEAKACERLVQEALINGGKDNITTAIISQ